MTIGHGEGAQPHTVASDADASAAPRGTGMRRTGPSEVELLPFCVADQAPVGTFVGSLSVVADPGSTVTFSLVDGCAGAPNANGSFALDGFDLYTSVVLDHSTAPTLDICVRATEAGDPPLYVDSVLSVTVLPPGAVPDV